MTNLKVQESTFESLGKIQDVIKVGSSFVVENGSTLPMKNYKGDMARLIITQKGKSLSVHTSAISIVEDIKKLNDQGLPQVDEEKNSNSASVKLVSYKTDFGTGYKFNYE